MSAADEERAPITDAEAARLFADLVPCKALLLAVSGGPDSTALLVLAARWRARRSDGPSLLAVTIDHGLRPEARREAAAVKRLAGALGVAHRTVRWRGPKPTSGVQQAARTARYRLLATAAMREGAHHIVTAHTLDDQAETLLFRLARGSGLTGLGGMTRESPLPVGEMLPLFTRGGKARPRLVRPFLDIPKARLVATLDAAQIPFVEDPSNRDPRFTRIRLRALMPGLAAEGLTAGRLAQLAKRLRRADAAIEAAVEELVARLAAPSPAVAPERAGAPIELSAVEWAKAPAEIRLRSLGRLIAQTGDEGDVELKKLEACEQAMAAHLREGAPERFRRTLAGALITLSASRLTIARAPPRRKMRRAREDKSAAAR